MKEAPAAKTALQESQPPPHPLDAAIQRIMDERLALKLGKASEWEESYISLACLCAPKLVASPEATASVVSMIGKWVIKAFNKRDTDALIRLAKCWESGGYDGIPHIAGSNGKLGRKDLLKCRNLVFGKILEDAKIGIPFDDYSLRLMARCNGFDISDETTKVWRDELLKIFKDAFRDKAHDYFCGGKYFLKSRPGAKKGTRQEHRVRS